MKIKTDEKPAYTPHVNVNPLDARESGPLRSFSEALKTGGPQLGETVINDLADGHTPSENLTDKDTNPKDVIGSGKLPLSLVPETLIIYASLAFLEGALKYGRYNWRIAGVRSSIYIDALKRHIAKYESGEDLDPETGVPHLSNMLACVGIIVDAKVCDMLTDDRPPKAPLLPDLINMMADDVALLKGRLAQHHPHQYTIADSPRKPA